jgi:spore coat polysaccharide biosynthesis protein SpsF
LDIKKGVTILDQLVGLIQTIPSIHSTVLGVSEGLENLPFIEYAQKKGIDYIVGDQKDVLQRLIQCGHRAGATDIFRTTTESPFFHYELVDEAWARHIEKNNDVTAIDGLPDGCAFVITTMEALERSHRFGEPRHRSELCHAYIVEHKEDFKIDILHIPPKLKRPDLRLTVDYPEDLVLCRRVYEHFKDKAPRIPIAEIIEFLDSHPELKALVAPYAVCETYWG